jgi:hypothetical protein
MTKDTGRTNIIALWACFALVYALTFAFPAHASQIDGSTFPTFTNDGTGYGSDTNGVYSYFGGVAFIPQTTFEANSFEIKACSHATTTLPVQVFYNISDITTLATTTGEYSNYPVITTVAGNIENCDFGTVLTSVNHSWDFDPTLYTFTVGHVYMIYPVDFGTNYDSVWGYIQYDTSSSTINNIQTCYIDLFCGGFFLETDHASMWVDFSNTGVAVVSPVTSCLMSTFPFIDIFSCISDTFVYLFVPQSTAFDSFGTLKDEIKDKAPFGYFTSAVSAISDISGTSTPAFTLATSSPIMTYIFNPLRTGLAWVLYLAGLIWIYKRLTNIDI